MRVCSWNIWAKGSSIHPRHWLLAAEYLKDQNADIIALQEVDCQWSPRTENADVAKEMADVLGFYYYFSPSISSGSSQYGNAVLSRYPITETRRIELSPGIKWDRSKHETEPRTAAWTRINVKGEDLIFISAHTANNINLASSSVTREQVKTIADLIKPGLPEQTVLCGDFNLQPESDEIRNLEKVIARRSSNAPTWPSQPFSYHGWIEEPPARYCIDYIFSNLKMNTWVGNSDLSDHLPVWGETLNQPNP